MDIQPALETDANLPKPANEAQFAPDTVMASAMSRASTTTWRLLPNFHGPVGLGPVSQSRTHFAGPFHTSTTPGSLVGSRSHCSSTRCSFPQALRLSVMQSTPVRHFAAKAQFLRQFLPGYQFVIEDAIQRCLGID